MAAEQGQQKTGMCLEDCFFKLPNEILSMICLHLSMRDVVRCMRLCKRFYAILSCKEFRKKYLKKSFKFVPVNKDGAQHKLTRFNLDKLLSKWCCFWDGSDTMPKASDPTRYIFRPFPLMWSNGVVTPANFEPFALDGDYNSFNKALYLVLKLRRMCRKFHIRTLPFDSEMNSVPDVCLFPWPHDDLPTPENVLKIFHAHEVLAQARNIDEAYVASKLPYKIGLSPDGVGSELLFDFYVKSLNNTFSKIRKRQEHEQKLFQWLHKLFQPSLFFCCGAGAIEPQLYFHLTILSPGWVGGILAVVQCLCL